MKFVNRQSYFIALEFRVVDGFGEEESVGGNKGHQGTSNVTVPDTSSGYMDVFTF